MRYAYLNGKVLGVVLVAVLSGSILAAIRVISAQDWLGLIYLILGYYLGNFRAVGRKGG